MTAPQHFHLPASILVETMRGWRGAVVLRAQVSGLPHVWTGLCLIELVLVQGTIYACTISTSQGQPVLHQEAAYQAVRHLGALEWTLIPSAGSVPSSRASMPEGIERPMSATSWLPRRTQATLSPDQRDRLSRRHQQVWRLIDGSKSRDELARLLTMDPQEVGTILHDLFQQQMIH